MTSLSDSQNIDLDRGGAPQLPPSSPIQACPHCDSLIDITECEPLQVIRCSGCGCEMAVAGQLANYTITEVAGRGGMGVVYKAYDPGLDRLVAVKLLRMDRSKDATIIRQLENEAAITASVNHPNVVRVFNTGTDRNRFFIAMELVDKGSLDDLTKLQGRVAEVQVLEVGIQIARGLNAAYQAGLIHRDVKPGNILFADARNAKIVDFGLAIFEEQEESVRGEIWGTPYYVAPEKLDNQPEDFRSDMYSLGASLYHALAGRPPFEAENASLVALKHLKAQQVSLQAFAPWVSNTTAHIINRTLQKNPDQRYQSYEELIQNLEFALDELRQHGEVPKQRARVVLETEDDQKQWTFLTFGIIGVIILLTIGGFILRSNMKGAASHRGTAATKSTPEVVATPESRFVALEKEIDALAGRSAEAAGQLRDAANGTKLSPTDRTWAQFLEGIAWLATGDSLAARGAFRKVPPLAARMKDESLGAFLKDTSAKLSEAEPIGVAETISLNRRNYEAIGLLAFGLHDWQLGKIDEGVSLLREFRNAKPAGSASWLTNLVPLGNAFMEDLTALNMKLEVLKTSNDAEERASAAAELRKMPGPLAKRVEAALAPFAAELAKIDAMRNAPPIAGLYRVINSRSRKGLDVEANRLESGGLVHQWGNGSNPNQQWFLTPTDGGFYKIVAAHSGKALDVADSRKDDDAPIRQWDDNGTPAQRWKVESAGEGKFRLKSDASGKVLTVENGATNDAAKIVQRSDSGAPEQLWTFSQVGIAMGSWIDSDIGDLPKAGSARIDRDTYTLTSTSADIWTGADSFHFLHRAVVGDFEMVARVAELNAVVDWTKAGIVVRNDMTPGARNVAAILTTKMGSSHQVRTDGGGQTTSSKYPEFNVPGWVKVERKGKTVTTFCSADGKAWKEMGSGEVTGQSGPVVFVGLALTSHDTAKAATVKFDNVRFKDLSKVP